MGPPAAAVYRPRNPAATPFHGLVERHFAAFERARCGDCGQDFFVAFSCKKRCFCPSCHQKRVLVFSERLSGEIFSPVAHRQFVFTVPKKFRLYFRYDRSLLGRLSRCAWETIRDVYAAVLG